MRSFTVRPYEPGDEEGIVDLFNRVFSEDNPAFRPRSVETWRGLYADNPAGMQTFVATDADGAVIANYSSIPAVCVLRGQRRLCTQAVDSCVERSWRGRLSKRSVFVTIATRFIEHFSTEGREPFDDYMWGLPNEQALPVGVRIIGYRPVHCPLPVLRVEVDQRRVDGWRARAGGVTVLEAGPGAPAIAAELFECRRGELAMGLEKGEAYLRWRYRERPDVTYRWALASRDGRVVGALVYRLGWMGQPLVPLVDWFGPGRDGEALAALLAHVGQVTLQAGGSRLETWATPCMQHAASLRGLGLHPEDSPFNLCIMIFGEGLDPAWAGEHWAVTMGDSDIY